MPLRSLRRIHRLTHRVIATVVAVSLLSMPVTYRGGAEAAHAHTIFQLWEDVRSGSFTHHPTAWHADEAAEPSGGDGAHAGPQPINAGGDPAPGSHDMVEHGEGAAAGTSVHASAASPVDNPARELVTDVGPRPAGMVEHAEDAPMASTAFTPSVRGSVLALPSTLSIARSASAVAVSGRTVAMDGIVISPTSPPPRPVS